MTTFLLVILAMTPCLVKAFTNPQAKHIIRWVAYACSCGFMFGWHVHEKASLHFTIPLALIAMDSLDDARHYFLLSIGMFLPPFSHNHIPMVIQFQLTPWHIC
jgi:alpha-1,3-glucosyltransferase